MAKKIFFCPSVYCISQFYPWAVFTGVWRGDKGGKFLVAQNFKDAAPNLKKKLLRCAAQFEKKNFQDAPPNLKKKNF